MFSNDDFDVDGAPIGNAQNDNARQIDEVKATIAGYYPFQATCEQDSDCTTSDLCAPGVCDGVCAYPPIDCEYQCNYSLSSFCSSVTSSHVPCSPFSLIHS